MLSWIARILKGMIIALGFILPGVSGGVLAAILGIYERMIRIKPEKISKLLEMV